MESRPPSTGPEFAAKHSDERSTPSCCKQLALAVHMRARSLPLDFRFLESGPDTQWHPQMMLGSTDIQHAVLRDFISPVEPRSHSSFSNYLKVQSRIEEGEYRRHRTHRTIMQGGLRAKRQAAIERGHFVERRLAPRSYPAH